MTSKLGDKIKSLREERKVGVRELGRLVDVSAMHISNIEKGKSSASAEIIQKIAGALNANPDELLALADQVAPDVAGVINNNSQAVQIIEAEMAATTERDEILQFIRDSQRGIMKGYFSTN